MSVRRLWVEVERWRDGQVSIDGQDHHYLFRVLRMARGESLVIFDGRGREADAVIESVDAKTATLRIGPVRAQQAAATVTITALVALIKGDRMDAAIEKMTELGVHRIVPIESARTVVRLEGARAEKRRARWEAVALAAARQSESTIVPIVEPVTALTRAVEQSKEAAKVVLWARGGQDLPSLLSERPASVAFLVGPEGGLTDEELACADSAGFLRGTLGPRILRAETAAITAAAAIGLWVGDLRHQPGTPGD